MRNKLAKIPDISVMYSNPGSDDHIIYSPIVEKDGTITLKESGKESISEQINSWRDTTDISYIMKRLSLGDVSILNTNPGFYGDFTGFPNDPAEVLQYQINAERYFYSLDPDIRNKFNNSVTEFLREGQNMSEKFFDSLGVKLEKEGEVINAESAE